MLKLLLQLVCLACGFHARPVPNSSEILQSIVSVAGQKSLFSGVDMADRQTCDKRAPDGMRAFASFLLVVRPIAGFKLSNRGLLISVKNPSGVSSRSEVMHLRQQPWFGARKLRRSQHNVRMCKRPANQSAENPARTSHFKGLMAKWMMSGQNLIKSHGVTVVNGYYFLSYVNLGITISIAWASFSKATGLSPLSPGQWKGFLGVFFAIHLALGVFTRPMRMALAVALKPLFERILTKIEERLASVSKRLFTKYAGLDLPLIPKDPKNFNGAVAHLTFNVFGHIAMYPVMCLGIYIGSLVTGVPALPLGIRSLWNWKAFLFLR